MLRVGLTGGLGSGKSTAANLFAALGAHILQSDAIGRELMEVGQPIYDGMVAHFGPNVVLADGTLDRTVLARIAFTEGRVEELNAIAHPLVIARQMELTETIFHKNPHAVVMVESALIFETHYGAADGSRWQSRFDRIILVTAPEEVKVARFVARSSAGRSISEEQRTEFEAEARRRLAQQISDEQKAALSDYVLTNGGALPELEWQVDQLWPILEAAA
ncbi:dephospho-CoA kinase [Tunturiibacter empetritectus]|uniref:Dephospho-CoA kinase n=2 Tax=Tunturiibacter TaxID=3154218 RepID=A0A852VHV5_9BACT|nr:dephospho-CoA kinase [Edaphobacter lichenicola]NYF91277.1 dephospho-CoA kinase [Edaphobacter lichenicola]